jgi:hypothetical protein
VAKRNSLQRGGYLGDDHVHVSPAATDFQGAVQEGRLEELRYDIQEQGQCVSFVEHQNHAARLQRRRHHH